MTEHEQILKEIIDQRGYLVMGTHDTHRPGHVMGPPRRWHHPMDTGNIFYVIEETDEADMEQQNRILAEIVGKPSLAFGTRRFPRFYRISTD